LTFDHNFAKCRPTFKILSLTDSQGKCLHIYDSDLHLTLSALLYYRAKFENSKLPQNFCSWHHN